MPYQNELIILFISLLLVLGFIRLSTRFTTETICPKCKTNLDLERIKNGWFVKQIPLLKSKKYICLKCNHKHYRLSFQTERNLKMKDLNQIK